MARSSWIRVATGQSRAFNNKSKADCLFFIHSTSSSRTNSSDYSLYQAINIQITLRPSLRLLQRLRLFAKARVLNQVNSIGRVESFRRQHTSTRPSVACQISTGRPWPFIKAIMSDSEDDRPLKGTQSRFLCFTRGFGGFDQVPPLSCLRLGRNLSFCLTGSSEKTYPTPAKGFSNKFVI